MLLHRKRRLYFLAVLVASASIAAALALYALRQNINLYYTPQQVQAEHLKEGQVFRLGGMVVPGSVQHGAGLQAAFTLTDYHSTLRVEYEGILPSLFREGQGIVAQGRLNHEGIFIADEVLAKHDANYKPPKIAP